ncbi:MAG: lipoprotein-releasing system ATP-binding protein [Blastocatellia bacterium]|jgi:lipoprotein-releasing system ATP-binding protein|nr:lipoprotein-releasing system ATP-binding protein [Blastocatellia bacterium]
MDTASLEDFGPSTLDGGLNVTGVCKSFKSPDGKSIEVLRGVSFNVAPGETIAITGASGAGKSTLLHLLGGLEPADEGHIALGEFEITQSSPTKLAQFRNRTIGFVFQFHHLLPDLTAVENVAMPLLISRGSRTESTARALQILERVGLRERADHPIRQLSGGEQQRVAVARSIVRQPRLVLADEPTGNLDTPMAHEIAAILAAYARSHQALIIVATHNQGLAEACDRNMTLAGGRLTEGMPTSTDAHRKGR